MAQEQKFQPRTTARGIIIIDLVTVFDAILTSRETCEKLQCLYENLMSNDFLKRLFWKKYDLYTKATKQRIVLKNFFGRACA